VVSSRAKHGGTARRARRPHPRVFFLETRSIAHAVCPLPGPGQVRTAFCLKGRVRAAVAKT